MRLRGLQVIGQKFYLCIDFKFVELASMIISTQSNINLVKESRLGSMHDYYIYETYNYYDNN